MSAGTLSIKEKQGGKNRESKKKGILHLRKGMKL